MSDPGFTFQSKRIGRFYERHFALFFMPTVLLDASGKIIHWNHHAEEVSGIAEDDMLATEDWPPLFGAHMQGDCVAAATTLFSCISQPASDAEPPFADAVFFRSGQDLTLVLNRPDPLFILCGKDSKCGRGAITYLSWSRCRDYDFTASPAVPLYEVLKALDSARPAWFGIQQNERYCYLSPEMIHALYGDAVTMPEIMGMPLQQTMSEEAAADHERTLSAMGTRDSASLNWPHHKARHLSWVQAQPHILSANGKPVNFSLVRDISSQKRNDKLLEALSLTNRLSPDDHEIKAALAEFAGISPAMRQTLDSLLRAALSLVTVFIDGETGTGKTQAARLIHSLSSRAKGEFVYVNCGAIPDELFESQLFGHVKGAFTGAVSDSEGLLTKADQGTLFLDEIGELSPRAQVKLLQALSERSYTPVGSTRQLQSHFRLVAATNRNLAEMTRQGTFREDLFYRINVMNIRMPSLRERREDIPLLVESIAKRNGLDLCMPPDAIKRLQAYPWPGNIRELENALFRYAAEGSLKFMAVGQNVAPCGQAPEDAAMPHASLGQQLEAAERDIIAKTLQACKWNRGKAAGILGISRPTLFRKMRAHHLL